MIAGDSHTVGQYVLLDVFIPAARDLIADVLTQGFERLIYGDGPRTSRRPAIGRPSGPSGFVNYSRYSAGNRVAAPPKDFGPTQMTPQSKATHRFDEIVLETRHEAQDVLASMQSMIGTYDACTVADLYDMLGENRTGYTDERWGWTNLEGAYASRVHGGYKINLPPAIEI
jgi:hypothetical protein